MNWGAELGAQLDWYWANIFWPRLAGLTNEEYLWEPVPGCWSVRPVGDGRFVADFQWPEPSPPRVTTIAWRLCHIAVPVLAWRNSGHFGAPTFDIQTFDWPGTAAAALALLDREYSIWRSGVETTDVDEYLISRLKLGQALDVSVDALADRTFQGRVVSIALLPELGSGGDQQYPVKIALEGADPRLRPGMTARIRLRAQ